MNLKNLNKISISNQVLETRLGFVNFRDNLLYSIFEGEYYSPEFSLKIDALIEKLNEIHDVIIPQTSLTKKRYDLAFDNLMHYKYLNDFVTTSRKTLFQYFINYTH